MGDIKQNVTNELLALQAYEFKVFPTILWASTKVCNISRLFWRILRDMKKNSVTWVRERTIPTERPPLVGEVSANFCGSLRPYSRLFRPELKDMFNLNVLSLKFMQSWNLTAQPWTFTNARYMQQYYIRVHSLTKKWKCDHTDIENTCTHTDLLLLIIHSILIHSQLLPA
jgi:hypothetical protein